MCRFVYKVNGNGERIPMSTPPKPFLPNPSKAATERDAVDIIAANSELTAKPDTAASGAGVGRKRGAYFAYDAELRAKIGKHASLHGNASTVKHFGKLLSHNINESTVRSLKQAYLQTCKQKKCEVESLMHGNRGKPLALGDLDDRVKKYIRTLRLAGGIVNRTVTMAAAKGIVKNANPSLLVENGGHVAITERWARSLLERMNFVRRKGTKAARHLPPDFNSIKQEFLERVAMTIVEHKIPRELVINFDQTGSKFVPVSEWTLEEQGSQQVSVTGIDDKREMTVLLSVTAAGTLLPPQLLYAGKTDKCHPSTKFPAGWDVWHSDSHWSTAETMRRYCVQVLVPYVRAMRQTLSLPDSQMAIALFDVYRAHQDNAFLQLLHEEHIVPIFIPASCTGELQPLDLSVNGEFKRLMKSCFSEWYSTEVNDQLSQGPSSTELPESERLARIKVNLNISALKPLHGQWLTSSLAALATKHELLIEGFRQAGLLNCF